MILIRNVSFAIYDNLWKVSIHRSIKILEILDFWRRNCFKSTILKYLSTENTAITKLNKSTKYQKSWRIQSVDCNEVTKNMKTLKVLR